MVNRKRKNNFVPASFKGLMTTRRKFLKLSQLPYICMYCGDPASDREHVIPYSYCGDNTMFVWSCRECNLLASDLIFESVEDKGRYIRERLKVKYESVLNTPIWGADEIDELDGNLKRNIKGMLKVQQWIRARVAWDTNPTVMYVVKLLQSNVTGKDSVAKLAEISGIPILELKQLITFVASEQIEKDPKILERLSSKSMYSTA